MASVQTYIGETYGNIRVRFRSSSNTEDLPGFNGAGLYTSISGQIENEERAIDDAIRTVWASLYLQRAYDERDITASMNPRWRWGFSFILLFYRRKPMEW